MVSKMFIKSKSGFNMKMVYQGKTRAIGKTQSFIDKLSEDGFRCFFDILRNTKNNHVAFLYFIHKSNRYGMTTSCFKECIDFIQNVIGAINMRLFVENLFMDSFCCGVELIFRDGKGTKCTRVYKDLQSSPLHRDTCHDEWKGLYRNNLLLCQ